MAEFKVTSNELKAKANELRNLNSQFKSSVEEMTSNEGSLASKWDGDAKEAFRAEFAKDKAQFETFYQTIEQYIVALENIAAEYEAKELQNIATAQARTS